MNSANFKITFTLTSHLFYHQTALHIAAKEGQEVTVKHLVKKGADINIKDNNGVGIWDYAIDDTLPKNSDNSYTLLLFAPVLIVLVKAFSLVVVSFSSLELIV